MSTDTQTTSKEIDDGGPAFPIAGIDETCDQQGGMSLRDYFAAAAMQGICAGAEKWDSVMLAALERHPDVTLDFAEFGSSLAYRIADVMLAERKAVRNG